MKLIAQKTEDGTIIGKINFYCKSLGVSRQGFYKYLKNRDKPYKYADLAIQINAIIAEDICNDTYGYKRMHDALVLRRDEKGTDFPHIPSKRTVYRIMEHEGLIHKPKRKPNGITKADEEARKSDDLVKRDFSAEKPCEKCVTDITEIPCNDGKLYVSAIEDCFDNAVLGIAMADNMRAELVCDTLQTAVSAYPELRLNKAIIHSDRGSQYTSDLYRIYVQQYGVTQSMNSAAGRCHDNAKCESLWARLKEELLYGRFDTKKMAMITVKSLVWRYFMSYWNNRRICSANHGLPPLSKRKKYYQLLKLTAA